MRYDTAFSRLRGGRARRGFTLPEMIIAVVMLALFGASAISFYLHSLRAVTNTAGRNDAQQTAAYALNFVDHDLRTAGTNLAPGQPRIVAAGSWFVEFNSDLVTYDTSASAGGIYYDANVPDSMALGWKASEAQNMPGSAIAYPDQTYFLSGSGPSGVLSNAETVQFYVRADSSAPAGSNLYILWRQVNSNAPTVVAKDLYSPTAGTAPIVFTYYYENGTTNALTQFPSAEIPAYHQAAFPNFQARLDSIKEIRVSFTGAFTDVHSKNQTIYRTVNEVIKISNAYMSNIAQCPGPTLGVTGLTASPSTTGQDTVGLSWPRSLDDGQGKNTSRLYIIYSKRHVDSTYYQIDAINAAALATYHYQVSSGLTLGTPYDFAVAVRDCTPLLSSTTTATNITPN
jgi:prepilin-type N-terminal cleavage/methylation domain-containing protein